MSSRLFIGFDGGATKTACVALDSGKKVVAEGVGKPANFQVIGVGQASKNILEVAESILKKLNAGFSQIEAMHMGLAGAGRKSDAEKMRKGFMDLLAAKQYPVPKIQVESDAVAALEGAFGGSPGMILIGGTGSILFAKEEDGTIERVGGWGRYIGDEGSGYALGRDCLNAIAKEFDGRGRKTTMTQLLKARSNIDGPESLISAVYQNNFDIASAASIVIDAAEKGDDVALEIISSNSDDLIRHISAMFKRNTKHLPLVLIGSILSSVNIYSRNFRKKVFETFPDIEIREPEFSPAKGAALLAYKLGEIKE